MWRDVRQAVKQLLRRLRVPRVKAVEEAVELVGYVGVVERGGVGLVPQRGGGIAVAEAAWALSSLPWPAG